MVILFLSVGKSSYVAATLFAGPLDGAILTGAYSRRNSYSRGAIIVDNCKMSNDVLNKNRIFLVFRVGFNWMKRRRSTELVLGKTATLLISYVGTR